MAVREILIYPDDRLRKETKVVEKFDDELKALVKDMFDTLAVADGIGLAAPQIGVSKKVVIIDIADTDADGNVIKHNPIVLVNPKILEKFGTTEYKEGCLSVPKYYENVTRAERIKLEAYDENGNLQTFDADGLLAICMQHELDHLDGHLFIDHLSTFKRDRIIKGLKRDAKERQG